MYAEAENELNGPAAAIGEFKKVRQRAFSSSNQAVKVDAYLAVAASTKDLFREAIKQERLLEFGGEGIRKYDLIRWNDLNTKIIETRNKLTALRDGTGAYANVPDVVYYKRTAFGNLPTVEQEVNTFDLFGGNLNDVAYKKNTQTATPTGYTAVSWRNSLVNAATPDLYIGGAEGLAHKFVPNFKELLPISQDIINENYNLKNDYGY
jgi:hypothetical protein